MKYLHSVWLGMILTMTASSVTADSVKPGVQPAGSKEITVTGRIIKLHPSEDKLTLQTTEGTELELQFDSRSDVRLHQQEAKLNHMKQGDRVRVRYQSANGKNRVLSLHDAPVTSEEVQQELREALEAVKAYTFQQKEEYRKRLEPVLRDMDERIEHLEEQAKGAGKQAQKQYAQAIQDLQHQKEVLRGQISRLQATAPGAWEEVKAGVSAAWDDLRRAFQRANDRLKETNSSDRP